jgi:UDP-GlcNAc:undecaprenyl-phosphate GlcNAc-1-phosphate transferase
LLLGGTVILTVGIIDDLMQLSAKVKLLGQIAAAIVLVLFDVRIEWLTNPFGDMINVNYLSIPLTIIWVVSLTNTVNLIDGLDGLAAGVSALASLSILFIAIMNGSPVTAILTAALAGATLGFLPYNFNPAKIFMGDTGSNFLGFVLGVISIQGFKGYTAIAITIPILVLGLPIFDTLFAILRRIANGKSPMEADRGHLHHRLIDMGLSQKQSVLVMYTVSGLLGLSAVVLSQSGVLRAIILVFAVSIFVITGAKYMGEVLELQNANPPEENTANSIEPHVNNEGGK